MKKVLSICVITALVTAFSTVCSFGLSNSKNKIIAPKTVKVGQKFKISLRGEKDTLIGTRTGQKKFVPDSWTISNNAPYSDYFFDVIMKPNFFNNYGLYPYKSKNIKFSYPGKYTILAEFYIATLDYEDDPEYSDEYSYWDTNNKAKYTKTKKIKVLGRVKFNPGKGTLKKASKIRWRAQNARIGKLPKPKRKGYTFKGWYTKKGGKGKKIKASTRAKFTGSTKNYYAKWKLRPCRLSNSKNKIIAPKTVKVGQKFKISLRGEKDTLIGTYTGQKKFVPDSWTISNNALYSDYFLDYITEPNFFNNYDLYPYKSKNIKFSYPGKYTIRAEFYIATLYYDDDPEYSDALSSWITNDNDAYTKTKKINVLGKVKFNPGKGTLKKASKLRWRAQNARIGKLPKPKRKGYAFKGWYTKKGGKGKKIKASTRAKFTGSTKNYYAKWKKR